MVDRPCGAQVRASSLNELIYKQGQAGVTKASVTLVFDNTDPSMSPHGYEQYSQIAVTRQVWGGAAPCPCASLASPRRDPRLLEVEAW